MIGTRRQVRVWAFPRPVDLRLGYSGLSGLVHSGLSRDPLSGDLYLFVSKRRTTCKVLTWDGTGLCIYMKRLERGRFAALWPAAGVPEVRLTSTELQLFVEGCTFVGRQSISPPEIDVSFC